MKVATRDDKTEWPEPPSGITTASVCRLSGKLATIGCEDVDVVSESGSSRRSRGASGVSSGELLRRSMVYTEYFARGTAPTDYCDLHPTRGVMTKMADAFSSGPVKVAPPGLVLSAESAPEASAATATAPSEMDLAPEPPRKKRGFWSKVFGIGRDDDRKRDDPAKKKGGK